MLERREVGTGLVAPRGLLLGVRTGQIGEFGAYILPEALQRLAPARLGTDQERMHLGQPRFSRLTEPTKRLVPLRFRRSVGGSGIGLPLQPLEDEAVLRLTPRLQAGRELCAKALPPRIRAHPNRRRRVLPGDRRLQRFGRRAQFPLRRAHQPVGDRACAPPFALAPCAQGVA